MTDKIFYSWQSDLPNKTNRGFIEDVLQRVVKRLGAPEDELYEPPRDLEVDKDTQGVPGSPPIADTIFKKIEECTVFVPDLTFVGQSEEGRPLCNPNVLIEYGWALAKCGHSHIVPIMNEAYGKVDETTLPFDLRHHSWPVRYHLAPDAPGEEKARVRDDVVTRLASKISDVLKVATQEARQPVYEPLVHKSRVSSFLDDGDVVCRFATYDEKPREIRWSDGPQMFMRVVPHSPIPRMPVARLKGIVEKRPLPVISRNIASLVEGNEHGVVSFRATNEPVQTTTDQITQVTNQGEIWSIDANMVRDDDPVPFFERPFAAALGVYLQFVKEALGAEAPVRVILGMSGVAGRLMWRPPLTGDMQYSDYGKTWGNAVKDDMYAEVASVSLDLPENVPLEIPAGSPPIEPPWVRYAYWSLLPAFIPMWDGFQLERPEFLPKGT